MREKLVKYRNIIFLSILLISTLIFSAVNFIDSDEFLLNAGYYDEKIYIAGTSDVHGHIVSDTDESEYYSEDANYIMGLPMIDAIMKEMKESNERVLFLDCGDLFHGTNEANIEEGKGVVEIVNKMDYSAMVPGNHDFNFGFERLVEIKSQIKFPILSANIYKNEELVFDEYKVFEIGDKKIGLFGLTSPISLYHLNTDDHENVEFEDPVIAAQRVVTKIDNKENVDIIVLMSHLGRETDEKIMNEINGIDLILSGHYHNLSNSIERIGNTYFVEMGAMTTHVGVAKIYFRNNKVAKISWRAIYSDNTELIDKELKDLSQTYHKKALEDAGVILGIANVRLNGVRSQVRSKETNLANLLTDAMREVGKADITLMNGGGIRQSIPEGEIDLYTLGKVLPFSNSLVTIEMSGEQIYKALERGLRSYPDIGNGGFLQVSGISYSFDATKRVGEKIVSVTQDGVPLNKDEFYRVATNDFLFNGGDGYEELVGCELISAGDLLKNVLAMYIKEKRIVEPAEEGRIIVINERYK